MSILIIILALVAVLAFVIARRPDNFHLTRSTTIAAAPSVIFDHVNDLHKWHAWSPWAKLDPDAKETFSGSPAGTGAIFHWAGNNKVGEGVMTITESRAAEFIALKLDFLRPFKATNTAAFTFAPDGDKTIVSWSMNGKNTFMSKAVGLIMNCEKMVGAQFDKGLASLKSVAEQK